MSSVQDDVCISSGESNQPILQPTDPVPLLLPRDVNTASYFYSFTPGQTDNSAYQPGESVYYSLPNVSIIRTASCSHQASSRSSHPAPTVDQTVPTINQTESTMQLVPQPLPSSPSMPPLESITLQHPTPPPHAGSEPSSPAHLPPPHTDPASASAPTSPVPWWGISLLSSALRVTASVATSAASSVVTRALSYMLPPALPLPRRAPHTLVLTSSRLIFAQHGRAEFSVPLPMLLSVHCAAPHPAPNADADANSNSEGSSVVYLRLLLKAPLAPATVLDDGYPALLLALPLSQPSAAAFMALLSHLAFTQLPYMARARAAGPCPTQPDPLPSLAMQWLLMGAVPAPSALADHPALPAAPAVPRALPSLINAEYSLCPSYPPLLLLPHPLHAPTVRAAADYRSRRRIPVLAYLHPRTRAPLIRCAQPLTGVFGRVSAADERLVQLLAAGRPITVVDCRTRAAATVNAMGGKGTEHARYGAAEFAGVGNIHEVRSAALVFWRGLGGDCAGDHCALDDGPAPEMAPAPPCDEPALRCADLAAAASPVSSGSATSSQAAAASAESYRCTLARCRWQHQASLLLAASVRVAGLLAGAPAAKATRAADLSRVESAPPGPAPPAPPPARAVVLHCSDNFDRASQVSILAQLLSDRRLCCDGGLCALVRREMGDMGHRFASRAAAGRWLAAGAWGDGIGVGDYSDDPGLGAEDAEDANADSRLQHALHPPARKLPAAPGLPAVLPLPPLPASMGPAPGLPASAQSSCSGWSPVLLQLLHCVFVLKAAAPRRFRGLRAGTLRRLAWWSLALDHPLFAFDSHRQRAGWHTLPAGGWEWLVQGQCAGRAHGCVCALDEELGEAAEEALRAAVRLSAAGTVDGDGSNLEEAEMPAAEPGVPVPGDEAHELAMLGALARQPEAFPLWRSLHQPPRPHAPDADAQDSECAKASVVLSPVVAALRNAVMSPPLPTGPVESTKHVEDNSDITPGCVACDQDDNPTLASSSSDTNSGNNVSIPDDIFLRVNPPLTENYLTVYDYGHILSKLSGN